MAAKKNLADEPGPRRSFRSTAEEAVESILNAAEVLRRFLSAVVEPYGITLPQYNVLSILRGAGSAGLPTLMVGEQMIVETPGITRLLDRLEKKGLVERSRPSADRRQVVCRLTGTARRLLRKLDKPMDDANERCLAALSPTDQKQLIASLVIVSLHLSS